jgi:hypothetical protein
MNSLPDDEYTLQWKHNVMYSMHLYDTTMGNENTDGTIRYRVKEMVQAREQRHVAVWIGELNNGDANQVASYNLYNQNHISWTAWTYKLAGSNMGNWSTFQKNDSAIKCNVKTESLDSIKTKWGSNLRTFTQGYTFTPGVVPTLINSYTKQGAYNFITSGLNYVIDGIATKPAGGEENAIRPHATLTTPVISPATQVFSNPQNNMKIQISCDDPNAVIHYTTDGTVPNEASAVYQGPFALDVLPDQPVNVIAKAFKGKEFSDTDKAVYKIKANEVPVLGADSCTGLAKPFGLELYSAPGTAIYYSLNGGGYALYTGPIVLSATTTVNAYTAGGGLSKSAVVTGTYEFAGPTDIKMYNDFSTLDTVTATSNTSIALNTVNYSPVTTDQKSLALTITSSGMPSTTTRGVSIAPQGGGSFDVTGYDYMIFWIYETGTDTCFMSYNSSSSGNWTTSNVGGKWAPIVIKRGTTGWPTSTNSFTSIYLGEYNARTYYIDCIYFAKAENAAPLSFMQGICQADVAPVTTQIYSGKAIEPSLAVTYNDQLLTGGTDYTVQYTNNINAGVATAKITGLGNFKGTIIKQFLIEPKEINSDMVVLSASTDSVIYSGQAIEPSLTVTYNDQLLTGGTDYTVQYTNNINAGVATAKITGLGNFKGTITKQFLIVPKEINSDMVVLSASTDSVKKPVATVKDGDAVLVEKRDYTVSYDYSNTTVTITGIGNYTGSVSKTYKVKAEASVKKLNGNKNELTITVTEQFSDGTSNLITQTFSIDNNAADTYTVGAYKVNVDTKGNIKIRECLIVK